MNTHKITEIAEYIQNETGYDIPPMTPFVGENFNLTRAGIHADGMMKNPEILSWRPKKENQKFLFWREMEPGVRCFEKCKESAFLLQ